MFLTDFRTRKYTGGIISRVGIFLTVTPAHGDKLRKYVGEFFLMTSTNSLSVHI